MTRSPQPRHGATDAARPLDGLSDEELIHLVRAGHTEAYGQLWIRHEKAARAVANRLSRSSADDLVAESFAKILRLLQAGKGPDDGFRAYLNTSIRNLHVDSLRRDGRVVPLEDEQELTSYVAPVDDALDSGPAAERAASAWESLSARDRWLTWAASVEGYTTTEIADRLDVRANTAAVWLHRARASLRTAFLKQYVRDTSEPECARQRDRFAAYLRGSLSDGRRQQLQRHLIDCADCRAVLAETAQVNARLRAAAPLLPVAAGAGLLSWLAGAHASSTAGGTSGATAAAGATGKLGGALGSGGSSSSGGVLIGAVAAVAVIGAALAVSSSGDVPSRTAMTQLVSGRPRPVAAGPDVPSALPSPVQTSTSVPSPVSTPGPGPIQVPTPNRPPATRSAGPTPGPSYVPAGTPAASTRPAPAVRPPSVPRSPSSTTSSTPTVPTVLQDGQVTFLVPVLSDLPDPTLTVTLPSGWTVTSGRIGPWAACAPGVQTCQFALGTLPPRMYVVRVAGRGPVADDDQVAVLALESAGRTIVTLVRPLR